MISPGSANPLLLAQGIDPLDNLGVITNSLRFRKSASAYLYRTFGLSSNLIKWTLGFKCKKSEIATTLRIFGIGNDVNAVDQHSISFLSSGSCQFFLGNGAGATLGSALTNELCVDPASHRDVLVVWDTANATAADRMIVWIDGVRQSLSSSSNPSPSQAGLINSNVLHRIGALSSSSTLWLDGYLSDFLFVDGQALTPTSFGQFHSITGQWRPKTKAAIRTAVAVGGGSRNGWGTNGFFLPFDDTTSTTTICYDRSQSDTDTTGNNWTVNNISLTAGVTYDSMIDTPTNNFCSADPNFSASGLAVGNGMLNLEASAAGTKAICGTQVLAAGSKVYFEFVPNTTSAASIGWTIGLMSKSRSLTAAYNASGSYHFYASNVGYLISNGSTIASGLSVVTSGTVLQFAVDVAAGKAWVGRGGTWYDSSGGTTGNPATGANATFTGSFAGLYPFFAIDSNVSVNGDLNFGQQPFLATIPSGFSKLCSKNLPVYPAVINSKTQMDAVLRSGTGASYSVTGKQLSPGLIINKCRSTAQDWVLDDIVRGTNKTLACNTQGAQVSTANGITAFNSDGYSGGSGSDAAINTSGQTYVDYLLKAGGSPVSNTAGTITSQVSANQTAGFSIVVYTGTSTTSTVGHGLAKAPKLIITFNLSAGFHRNVYHSAMGATKGIRLNEAAVAITSINFWNNTAPTSSVFTVGALNSDSNNSGDTIVAYCFSDETSYSAFGEYTGNASTDGPFNGMDFSPGFILIKRTDVIDDWRIRDVTRDTWNMADHDLKPNLSQAEATGSAQKIAIVSNGFRIKTTDGAYNASGGNYIWWACAGCGGFPFRYANAR